jgi:hypothetical protein
VNITEITPIIRSMFPIGTEVTIVTYVALQHVT